MAIGDSRTVGCSLMMGNVGFVAKLSVQELEAPKAAITASLNHTDKIYYVRYGYYAVKIFIKDYS